MFGIYTKQPDLVNGKPWYRGTNPDGNNADKAIYFAINGINWHMGPEEWIDKGYTLMYQSGLSECPGNHDSWKVQNSDGDWIETAVTVNPTTSTTTTTGMESISYIILFSITISSLDMLERT